MAAGHHHHTAVVCSLYVRLVLLAAGLLGVAQVQHLKVALVGDEHVVHRSFLHRHFIRAVPAPPQNTKSTCQPGCVLCELWCAGCEVVQGGSTGAAAACPRRRCAHRPSRPAGDPASPAAPLRPPRHSKSVHQLMQSTQAQCVDDHGFRRGVARPVAQSTSLLKTRG